MEQIILFIFQGDESDVNYAISSYPDNKQYSAQSELIERELRKELNKDIGKHLGSPWSGGKKVQSGKDGRKASLDRLNGSRRKIPANRCQNCMDLEKKLLLSEYKNFNLLYENKKLKAAFQGNMNANIFNSCIFLN